MDVLKTRKANFAAKRFHTKIIDSDFSEIIILIGAVMSEYTFRIASREDITGMLDIYGPYVMNTAITFEVETPSVEVFRKRISSISAEYPCIVCLRESKVVGYAYAHRHMERAAYQWNAELSVYIDLDCHGCGIGKKLYAALLEMLKLQNIINVYGGVTVPNEKSEKLHRSCGFTKLGTYRKTGYKCGRWHDVAWFEKSIGPYSLEPEQFIPFQDVDKAALIRILTNCL